MINEKDIEILRELANKKAEISQDSSNYENIELWKATNDLKMNKPPVYINELPWHEMNVEDELTLKCESEFARNIEENLKREIYLYNHLPGNMVVLPTIECPISYTDTDFGIVEDVDIKKADDKNSVVSRHFNIQISCLEDIAKIKDPIVALNEAKTNENLEIYHKIFDGILKVEKTGIKGMWFTPWDYLVRWTGVQEALMDLIVEPDYVEKLVERFVDAQISRLNQYKNLGLWASNNNNTRVGSGGYGYTTSLKDTPLNNFNVPTNQIWGCGNAQVFSEVSPQMHWDFSLKYEMKWLENFGLNYYGCCEALHNKLGILEKIPNLRKISASPWAKIEKMTDICKDKYVLSCKPNPAIFTNENWSEQRAEKEIRDILDKSKGANIEIIMKDVSTVNYNPQRVWEWCGIAETVINQYYR